MPWFELQVWADNVGNRDCTYTMIGNNSDSADLGG